MDRDERPANAMQDLRDLQHDVAQAQASGGREALTKASLGWQLPNMATPDPPAVGGHLYASGDEPFWIDSGGTVTSLKADPVPQASDVGGMSGLSTPNGWPPDYSPATGEAVQDDLVMLRDYCLALRAALRAAGLMA